MTDGDRRQVYMAETAALLGTPFDDAPGADAIRAGFGRVFGSQWWTSIAGGQAPVVKITGRHVNGAFRPATNTITIGADATWLTMAHELAHAVHHHLPTPAPASADASPPSATTSANSSDPHDAVFRACEIVVFTAVFGPEVAAEIASAFERFGLLVSPVDWSPTPTPVPMWFGETWRVERGGWRSDRRQTPPRPANRGGAADQRATML